MRPLARRSVGRSRAVFVLAVAALGLVASCSSDSGDSSSTTSPDVTLSEATDGGATDGDQTVTTATPVDPGTAEEYTTALLASLTEDPDNTGLMDASEAACIAPKWIASITPERLGAAGLAPADLETQRSMAAIVRIGLSIEEAEGLVAEMSGCGVDVRSRSLAALSSTDGAMTPESEACLEKNLSTELTDRMAAIGLSGAGDDPVAAEASSQFLTVLQQCGLYPDGN